MKLNQESLVSTKSFLGLFLLFFLTWASPAWAASLTLAAKQLVSQIKSLDPTYSTTSTAQSPFARLILQVKNRHSKLADQTAQAIELELRQVFTKDYKSLKLVLPQQALAGVPSKGTLQLMVEYESSGPKIHLHFQVTEGLQSGTVLLSGKETFLRSESGGNRLIAVLDFEGKGFSGEQLKALSEVFRARLSGTGKLALSSSAEVDKMRPDEIQRQYHCSRDECATLIGEQLGVDQVISAAIYTLSPGHFVLSAKLLEIRNRQIVASESITAEANLIGLPTLVERLADQLLSKNKALLSPKIEPFLVPSNEPQWTPPGAKP